MRFVVARRDTKFGSKGQPPKGLCGLFLKHVRGGGRSTRQKQAPTNSFCSGVGQGVCERTLGAKDPLTRIWVHPWVCRWIPSWILPQTRFHRKTRPRCSAQYQGPPQDPPLDPPWILPDEAASAASSKAFQSAARTKLGQRCLLL